MVINTKEILSTENMKAEVYSLLETKQFMMVILHVTQLMAMVKQENKMVINTKDIGLTIKNRDRVKNIGKMVQAMKVNKNLLIKFFQVFIQMMLDKAKENMFGLTKAFMRENGTITNSMDLVNINWLMEEFIQEHGQITNLVEKEC